MKVSKNNCNTFNSIFFSLISNELNLITHQSIAVSKLYPKSFDTKTIHQSVRLENVPESIAISPFPTNLHIITWPNCNKPTRWVAVLSNRLQFVWLKFVCCRELAASNGPELRTESRGERVEPDERMEQDKKQLKCVFPSLMSNFLTCVVSGRLLLWYNGLFPA